MSSSTQAITICAHLCSCIQYEADGHSKENGQYTGASRMERCSGPSARRQLPWYDGAGTGKVCALVTHYKDAATSKGIPI